MHYVDKFSMTFHLLLQIEISQKHVEYWRLIDRVHSQSSCVNYIITAQWDMTSVTIQGAQLQWKYCLTFTSFAYLTEAKTHLFKQT